MECEQNKKRIHERRGKGEGKKENYRSVAGGCEIREYPTKESWGRGY